MHDGLRTFPDIGGERVDGFEAIRGHLDVQLSVSGLRQHIVVGQPRVSLNRRHAEAFALEDIRQPLQTLVLGATAQQRAGSVDPTAPVFDTLRHLVLMRGHHRWLQVLPDWIDRIPTRCVVELPPSAIDLQLPWHIVLPAREDAPTVELAWDSALPPSVSQLDAVVPLLRAAASWTLVHGRRRVRDALSEAIG